MYIRAKKNGPKKLAFCSVLNARSVFFSLRLNGSRELFNSSLIKVFSDLRD